MIRLSYDVKKYRSDICELVNPDDTVIELGCHTGGTTRTLPESCNIIAVDNSPEASDRMNSLEYVKFINGDVRKHEILAEVFKISQSCDVLAIDLGGGYHPDTVFKVFYIYSSTFKPTHTIIRNRGLLEFLNSAQGSGEDFVSQYGFLGSYHDSGIPPLIKEFDFWTPSLKKL